MIATICRFCVQLSVLLLTATVTFWESFLHECKGWILFLATAPWHTPEARRGNLLPNCLDKHAPGEEGSLAQASPSTSCPETPCTDPCGAVSGLSNAACSPALCRSLCSTHLPCMKPTYPACRGARVISGDRRNLVRMPFYPHTSRSLGSPGW